MAAQDVYSANVRLAYGPELRTQLGTLFRYRLRAGRRAGGQARSSPPGLCQSEEGGLGLGVGVRGDKRATLSGEAH